MWSSGPSVDESSPPPSTLPSKPFFPNSKVTLFRLINPTNSITSTDLPEVVFLFSVHSGTTCLGLAFGAIFVGVGAELLGRTEPLGSMELLRGTESMEEMELFRGAESVEGAESLRGTESLWGTESLQGTESVWVTESLRRTESVGATELLRGADSLMGADSVEGIAVT